MELKSFWVNVVKFWRSLNTLSGAMMAKCFQTSVWRCLAMPWASMRFRGICVTFFTLCKHWFNTGLCEKWSFPKWGQIICLQTSLWVCCPLVSVSILMLSLTSTQQEMQVYTVQLAKTWLCFWVALPVVGSGMSLALCLCLLKDSHAEWNTCKMNGPYPYFTNVCSVLLWKRSEKCIFCHSYYYYWTLGLSLVTILRQ